MTGQSARGLQAFIEGEVSSGRLKPGEALPSERSLAVEFSLSRPVVREALRELRQRGFIATQPGRGTYVRETDHVPTDLAIGVHSVRRGATRRQFLDARRVLETYAAGEAAERRTEEQAADLIALAGMYGGARSRIDAVRVDLAFHYAVVHVAGNPILELMFAALTYHAAAIMLETTGDSSNHNHHERLARAIQEQDPAAARAALESHFDHIPHQRATGEDFLTLNASRVLETILGPNQDLHDLVDDLLGKPAHDYRREADHR